MAVRRLAALFLGLAAALLFSGAAAARQVSDPGALVRWGLPISKAIHNVSLATVIGGLIFAVGILPRNANGSRSKDTGRPGAPGVLPGTGRGGGGRRRVDAVRDRGARC